MEVLRKSYLSGKCLHADYLIFSAENSPFSKIPSCHLAMMKILNEHIQSFSVKGKYNGVEENSIFIPSPTKLIVEYVEEMAKSVFLQESIIVRKGNRTYLKYLNGPKAGLIETAIGFTIFDRKPKTDFTQIGENIFFTLVFDEPYENAG